MALDVSANNISGALPDQLVGGPAQQLQYLYLSRNSFTGARLVSVTPGSIIQTCHHHFMAAFLMTFYLMSLYNAHKCDFGSAA